MYDFLILAVGGAILRFLLFQSDYQELISERVEVSTPLNSWKRVVEGVYLSSRNISPYDGDLFHETPLGLCVFSHLLALEHLLPILFIICDIVAAYALSLAAKQFLLDTIHKERTQKVHAPDAQSIFVCKDDSVTCSKYVAAAYLLNPYMILNCVAQTTTVFGNLCIASGILFMVKGKRILTTLFLAFAAYQSFYPVMLLVPAAIYILNKENGKPQRQKTILSILKTVLLFMFVAALLMSFSFYITNSWDFITSTYGFIVTVPDLTPNIGLFWYFFTEMFEHFRMLFLCTFQINAFIYVIPLTIRFHSEPMLLVFSFSALIATFKSYPCIGDVGLYLAVLPMWRHLYPFVQQTFVVACFFFATSILGPILWHLWIYAASANANFFFGVTLAYGTAQIFLLTDVLFAYTKREFHLRHGLKKEIDGKPAKLMLE